MASKINIFSETWCNILFQNRNKVYGAYTLRKDTCNRHLTAICITIVCFLLCMIAPAIIKAVAPKKKVEQMVEVTVLSDLQLEQKKTEQPKDIIMEAPPPLLKSTIKFTPPVIKPDEEVKDTVVIKTQEEVTKASVAISVADVKGSTDEKAVDIADLNKQVVEDTISQPYVYVEQMPQFPGGDNALHKFISSNLRYPESAIDNGIVGRVFVQFVVNSSGIITSVKVLRGIGGGCDEEAIRVIKSMPKWLPGKQNGSPVRVQFVLPIVFQLQ